MNIPVSCQVFTGNLRDNAKEIKLYLRWCGIDKLPLIGIGLPRECVYDVKELEFESLYFKGQGQETTEPISSLPSVMVLFGDYNLANLRKIQANNPNSIILVSCQEDEHAPEKSQPVLLHLLDEKKFDSLSRESGLIIVCGWSGTGKTVLASKLSRQRINSVLVDNWTERGKSLNWVAELPPNINAILCTQRMGNVPRGIRESAAAIIFTSPLLPEDERSVAKSNNNTRLYSYHWNSCPLLT